MCIFVENDKQLNPFKYIESLKNKDCNAALMRIVPKINVEKIKKMINEIPNEVKGIQIISDIRKEFYCKCIEYRYEKSLYSTYLKMVDPFYSSNNIRYLENIVCDIKEGKAHFAEHELIKD